MRKDAHWCPNGRKVRGYPSLLCSMCGAHPAYRGAVELPDWWFPDLSPVAREASKVGSDSTANDGENKK